MYRSTAQVEAQRELNNSRNPLGPTTTLGPFLEAIWARRGVNDNATGVDFCVVELAVGARRGELSSVRWAETLSEEERAKGAASHVMLDEGGDYGPYMFFDAESTKNRRAHRIPLGPFLVELLRRRRDEAAEETEREGFGRKGRQWVFPARNRMSSSGVYHDPSYLLDAVAEEIGVDVLNPHDLRRSLGSVMVELQVPEGIQSRLFNHTAARRRTIRARRSPRATRSPSGSCYGSGPRRCRNTCSARLRIFTTIFFPRASSLSKRRLPTFRPRLRSGRGGRGRA